VERVSPDFQTPRDSFERIATAIVENFPPALKPQETEVCG
jgi:hypothetical protein